MSVDGDEQEHKPRLAPLPPVEPRLGTRTPAVSAAKSDVGGKITLPGISSLLEPSFRLRPVSAPRSPMSSDKDDETVSGDSESAATSRAGMPAKSGRASSMVLPSFASIASNSEVDAKGKAKAMLVTVNRVWLEKHDKDEDRIGERREDMRMWDVKMVA
ncbi:hypothetical protein FRC06_006148 [Ceratobasidium sp. 370]|nr:hypothetical protein FRC06_006148 [Ceratobasidium sp. 370]